MQRGTQPHHRLTRLNIQQDSFKLGSLDQLMALNESSAKMDNLIDKTCKKFEKICFETGSAELKYVDEMDETKIRKPPSQHTNSSTTVNYREYIEKFTWDFRKYNTKLSLQELCNTISKVNTQLHRSTRP